MLAAVVGMAHGNVIGSKNELPWYLPADLRHFRDITTGHAVIMGRNTADSIVNRLGHALPNRENVVITRQTDYKPEGFTVVHSLDDALARVNGDAFIIGGQQIFDQAFPLVGRLYVTEVDADIDGDTYFPEIEPEKWRETERVVHQKDEKNAYNYAYVTYDRI